MSDTRPAALKALFIDTAKALNPELAEQAITPEGDAMLDTAAEALVKGFDILLSKPSA